MKTETLEAIGAVGSKATILGGSVAVAGKFSAADLAAYVGAAVAVIGLIITWFYKREANKRHAADDRRREAEHHRREVESDLRMQLMRTSSVPVFHRDTDLDELGDDD